VHSPVRWWLDGRLGFLRIISGFAKLHAFFCNL
jgi:hypothetical protein